MIAPFAVEPFHAAGEGEPLVLLHGFTDTWRAWTPVIELLAQHHAVFAPTLPGHHGGEPFPLGDHMTIPSMLDMLERLLDAQGIEKAHLAGNSLGGWLSFALATRGRALSVTGICPAGGWEHLGREHRAVLRFFRNNDRLLRHGRPLLEMTAKRPRLRRFALRDLVTRPERVSAGAAHQMFLGAVECAIVGDALALAGGREDMFGELGEIDCPVRIAYGTGDRLLRWPGHFSKMRRLLPDADYVALEGVGHLPMWDDPELVARTILEVSAPARSAVRV